MLANAAMHQALINRGLTYRLDCDTVEPEPKLSLRPIGWKALRVDKGFRL